MIRKLLSASLLAVVGLSVNAHEIGDKVYTINARYEVTGADLVTNGQFNGFDGWNPIDESATLATVFTNATGGPNGSSTVKVNEGNNALTDGIYQSIVAEEEGTYIVTLSVTGTTEGYTDLDLSGSSTNYINVYANTDNTLATVDGTTLGYGTDGVSGGYGFSYDAGTFTSVTFAVEAPASGFIIIDCRALVDNLEIADVQCHKATAIYDDRVATSRLAYFQKYLNAYDFSEKEGYEDFQEAVNEVQAGLEADASADEMSTYMENLNNTWTDIFQPAALSNVIDLIPTTDGTDNTGNYSANWMNWTGKYNKLNSDYGATAPWSWDTDRWCHKTAATDSPMSIQWMRGSSVAQTHTATLTATLDAGTYFWGLSGDGGMMTLNKNRWARSWAKEAISMQLFFNGDTTALDTLSPAITNDYVYCFTLDESKEITLGIILDAFLGVAQGADANLYSPVLYKVLVEGELTPEEQAFLDAIQVQLDALAGRIDVANAYLAADQTDLPWGKEDLQVGVTEAQARYDTWAAMSQDEMLETMYEDDDNQLQNIIMNNGVRYLNNNYITPFVTLNAPVTDLATSISNATTASEERLYSGSSLLSDLQSEITTAQALLDAKKLVEYSAADSTELADETIKLDALVESYKLAISSTTYVDIDFNFDDPTTGIVTNVDETGETETTYTITGAAGTMYLPSSSYPYELGYNSTDSLGMLRVGNGEAKVSTGALPAKSTDIVNVQFDFYFGNLVTMNAGFAVATEAGDTICALICSKYSGTELQNTFAVDFNNNITGVGSSAASNAAIAASSNCTHFNIVLDYGKEEMYCTYSGTKGTFTTEAIYLNPAMTPYEFILYSNYTNSDRRCWFDNLKVLNIAADAATGISEVASEEDEAAQDGAIYNLAGQRISSAAKGQIVIQNGKKVVK